MQFTIERSFYQTLGWTYRDLQTRPRKQVEDYLTIFRLIEHHEKVKRSSNA